MKINFTDDDLREWVTISEHKIGNFKLAVFRTNHQYCSDILDCAVEKYVGNEPHFELVDISFSDPWTRVVTSNFHELDQSHWKPFQIPKQL